MRRLLRLACATIFLPLVAATTVSVGRDDCIDSRCVGILYETWFNTGPGALDFPRLPVYPASTPVPSYRCWGVPAIGAYSSTNLTVADIHAAQIAGAGVDFIIMDYSNSNIANPALDTPMEAFLQHFKARRAAGKPTPRVAFLIPADEKQIELLYTKYYQALDADDVFFFWSGKPLVLTLGECTFDVCSNFTSRDTWALRPQGGKWSFMDLYPQPVFSYNGVPEQMAVSAAQQETYMSATTAHGRSYDFRTKKNDGIPGQNFADQWQRAIDTKVKAVVVKSWNEWCSIKQAPEDTNGGEYTDEYNADFSNDVEPELGGHGDKYLRDLTTHIKAFKNGAPRKTPGLSI